MIAGLGHDIVNVSQFVEQMSVSNGWRALFSTRELRQCSIIAKCKHDDEAIHIAARWAGKESVIKAWCEALGAFEAKYPYTLDNTPWNQIEILSDSHGCPSIHLSSEVKEKLVESLKLQSYENVKWHISLSHDGDVKSDCALASVVVILEIL